MNQDVVSMIVNGMSKKAEERRSKTQMTLGDLIKELENLQPEATIHECGHLHSYRGYYSDLCVHSEGNNSVKHFLEECKNALGACFEGWKGGEFWMTGNTPMWHAPEGCCGPRIMSLRTDDEGVYFVTEEESHDV